MEINGAYSPIPAAPGSRLQAWLVRHRLWVLAALVVVAAVVRVVYFLEADSGPLVHMHKGDQTDMGYYDFWARRICDGDWLSEDVPPPMHIWHQQTAEEYLRYRPSLRAELAADAPPGTSPEALLWQRWIGPKRFYQEPAYPYLVALTYLALGPDVRWVFLWQMVLGVLSVVLVHRIAERHFDPVVAVLAALAAALSSALLMHEVTLLRESPIVFVGLTLVCVTDLARERGGTLRWACVGLVVGLALLLKDIFLLYLLGLLGIMAADHWGQWRRLAGAATLVMAALVLVISPVILRNVRVGVPPLAISGGNAGVSFIENNHPAYDWEATTSFELNYLPRLMGETGGQLLPAVIATLGEHPNAWSVVWMYCRKFDSAWHWWERPDNINIYHYQLYAPILKYLPVTFLLLAPPALVGLVLAGRRWRRRAALYLLVLTALAPLVVFNVPARYRLLLIAAVFPFAAMAVAETVRWLWMRRWVRGGTVLAILLLLGLWTGRPLPEHVTLVRICDPATAFEAYYLEPLNEALRNRDWARAAAIMEDFLKVEPDPVPSLGPGRPAVSRQKSRLALLYAEAHADCGRLYQAAGDAQAAEKHQRRAAELLEARQTAPAP